MKYPNWFSRWCVPISLAASVLGPAHAQSPQSAAPTLQAAFEAAWQRQPQARSAAERRNELVARARGAGSLSRGAPAVTLENWSDRWTQRDGFAKYAGEFALPLWLPSEQGKTQASITAETAYFEAVLAATRLKLAGELRELFWAAHLAQNDVAVATLRLEDAQRLAEDLQRRERAGALARVDAQTALAQVQLAQSVLAQSQSQAYRALRNFEQTTGLSKLPEASPEQTQTLAARTQHPHVEAAQLAVTAAQKQYELVAATLRDGPELGIGMFRERGREINPFDNIVTLRLRIPFATEARNQPRLAAANAVWIEAQTVLEQEQTRIAGNLSSAREEMEAARRTVGWAQTRRELARDNLQLITRAFELGERDLASRLRAQTEFFDAELAAQRAGTELLRAAARVQQALGQLP